MVDETTQTILTPRFGEGFLEDHAGRIMSNPHIAIVELVANSWDAGARKVDITWPVEKGGYFEIVDNGTGMTQDEFEKVWSELSYNRVQKQGTVVKFPDPSLTIKRSAYGRNGKGRHSLFCFSNEYNVETWRDGFASQFHVKKSHEKCPYEITLMERTTKEGHGTKIYCNIVKNHIDKADLQEFLGSTFITDPDFKIYINSRKIDLFDLQESEGEEFEITGENEKVRILKIDSKESGRISKQHGVAWWVNNRLVGEHSWRGIEGAYLDARTSQAKRFTFIVQADLLKDEVKTDWSWFKDTERANRIIDAVNSHILKSIQMVMQDARCETKRRILSEHKNEIKGLSNLSKDQIGSFVNQIQMKCPTMSQKHLSDTIEILTTMELSRTGYDLLQQLVHLSPDDLDDLSEILDKWSVNDARKVLDVLHWRLDVINKLEDLVEDPKTSELHELQPLFEKGLWIFGPEYEAIEFRSNRSLSTIIKEFFKGKGCEIKHPLKRPDFVILPDSSIGVYSSNQYDDYGEVCGLKKVLIVELKKGGSTIETGERRQAEDYAESIVGSGKVDKNTKIICYVLGANVNTENNKIGENIEVIPRSYSTVLHQAHARTFNLLKTIKEFKGISDEEVNDEEIKEILSQSNIEDF